MKQIITFYKHEIASAQILEKRLTILGFKEVERMLPKRLVELHQVRFYKDTTDKTYRAFLRKLGKGHIEKFRGLLLADRAGNASKAGRPLLTRFHNMVFTKLYSLETTTVFERDLCLHRIDLILMKVPKHKIQHAIDNMTGIVQAKPGRNTYLFLTRFIQKNYLEQQDDRPKGLPDF
jgi:hypothetical protein